ncbi:MAG TPA: adenylate/guanylate cyclase domain-containing protein [Candidatus Binatia bacterium]|jgi:class 3 adenylate cyclase|nr:adenylate/guanylate cyclase domain-containing protein [Candidatus Binatia bacterium]
MFMPVLTFRFKLALAMMLLVAGGAVTTLFIVQRRVQAYYKANFRSQFERQIAYFLALQDTRLANVKEECLKLSQKVRIIAAMSEQEIPAEILYDVTDDELKALLGSMFQEARLAGITSPVRRNATFFRYLDVHGNPVSPPESVRSRLGFPLSRRRLEQKLAQIRGALDSPERQQVGYLAFMIETNRPASRRNVARSGSPPPDRPEETNAPALQEVVITKILEPDSNQALGALVLGFPLSELIPQPKPQHPAHPDTHLEPIQSGILLEDHLYANTNAIPEPAAALVADDVSQRIHTTQKPQDDFEVQLQDAYYRVFYQLLNPESGFPPAYQVCLYSMAEARREQQQLRWQILGSGSAALLGALVLGLFLSHGLTVPVRELVGATREIRRGNLAVKVPVRSRDEIGQLAASFNEMAEGLAQKERYRTVLNQVADEQVARQLLSGEITLGGEVRQASVLFCDIRGFTALTEHMPPGEVIEMINEHMTALTRVVKQHNGVLDKFVGDLLMAIFGAPVSHDNDALDAARCALGLVQERQRLNQTSRHKLKIGLGLTTGKVVAGGMGSSDRFHYTVLGERVNLASRLCDFAGPGDILIDLATCDSLAGRIIAEPVPAMALKGFGAPVPVFKLLAVNSPPANS